MPMPTPYEVLGVAPDSSSAEIRQAYRRLADIYHPDRLQKAAPDVQAEGNRRMFELNLAYEELVSTSLVDVDYDTDGWTNRQRAATTEALLDAGIPHEWAGTSLLISPEHEEAADRILYE